mmetsp:Transcript_14144/g.50832  ORF Transcript_14144/g.50832 Transcript_14144/m.50832 type:complete len:206 (+) Transcript_14144:1223-1840(+)
MDDCFPVRVGTPISVLHRMSMNIPCATIAIAPSSGFHAFASRHSQSATPFTRSNACATVSQPRSGLHHPFASSSGTTHPGNSASSCAFVIPVSPTTPPSTSFDPSKHPPCSWMSPRTRIGVFSALATGVAVSMQRRIGDENRRAIACSGFAIASPPRPNADAANAPSSSACAKPFSVSDGSEDRSGLPRDGTASALFALCAWRIT